MYNTAIYEVAEPRTLEITKEMEQELANAFELDLEVDSIKDLDEKEVLDFFEIDSDVYYAEWEISKNEITYNYKSDYHKD